MLVSHYAFVVEEVPRVLELSMASGDCKGKSLELARKWRGGRRAVFIMLGVGADCSSVLITTTNQLEMDYMCDYEWACVCVCVCVC